MVAPFQTSEGCRSKPILLSFVMTYINHKGHQEHKEFNNIVKIFFVIFVHFVVKYYAYILIAH